MVGINWPKENLRKGPAAGIYQRHLATAPQARRRVAAAPKRTDGPTGKKKAPQSFRFAGHKSGNDLLSREIPVSSAFESLTTVFGMGTGVTSQVELPENRRPPRGQPVFWLHSYNERSECNNQFHRCKQCSLNHDSRAQPCFIAVAFGIYVFKLRRLPKALRKKVKPHDKLVPVSSTYYYAYTSGLSTS